MCALKPKITQFHFKIGLNNNFKPLTLENKVKFISNSSNQSFFKVKTFENSFLQIQKTDSGLIEIHTSYSSVETF